MPNDTQNLPAVSYYTPVELVGIYRSFLERGKSNGVVWLRGIYIQKPNQNPGWAAFYDELRDVNTNVTVTLKINRQDRSRLQSNSLVQVGGIIELNPFTNGTIQIVVNVTRFEIVKDQFITENELKLFDLRKKKLASGLKNVKAVLSQIIMEGKRKPKVALILAQGTRTQGDFEDGLRAARASFDFDETRVTFTQTDALCNIIRSLDGQGYDAIAIYRGGGIDSNTDVDKPEVIEAVVGLKTAFISGVGHRPETIFLREVADYWTSTPQGLGQYFSEIHENASAMRNNSRAALIEDIKKQFIKQIEDANKKNKELLAQIEKMTKQAQEQSKANQEAQKKQLEENTKNLQKLQEENKKNLEAQQKKNDEALAKLQGDNKKSLETFQKQATEQLEAANKQNAALQKQLQDLTKSQESTFKQLQEQQKETTRKLEKEQQHSRELEQKLASRGNNSIVFVIIAAVALAIGFIIAKSL
jgi:hypothetical protein